MPDKASFAESMAHRTAAKKSASAESSVAAEGKREGRPAIAPSRLQKAPLVAYIDKPAMKLVKIFCAEEEIGQQDLVIAAVNEYLTSRGRAGIL